MSRSVDAWDGEEKTTSSTAAARRIRECWYATMPPPAHRVDARTLRRAFRHRWARLCESIPRRTASGRSTGSGGAGSREDRRTCHAQGEYPRGFAEAPASKRVRPRSAPSWDRRARSETAKSAAEQTRQSGGWYARHHLFRETNQ